MSTGVDRWRSALFAPDDNGNNLDWRQIVIGCALAETAESDMTADPGLVRLSKLVHLSTTTVATHLEALEWYHRIRQVQSREGSRSRYELITPVTAENPPMAHMDEPAASPVPVGRCSRKPRR